MAQVMSFNDILNRVAANFTRTGYFYGEYQAATSSSLFSGQSMGLFRAAWARPIDNPLPTGVSAFLPVTIGAATSTVSALIVARQFLFGSINLSTNVYTNNISLPTQTIGNTAAQQTYSSILGEAASAVSATPGNLTITYTNQTGTSHSTGAKALTASAIQGTLGFVGLAAGDWGASNITAVTATGGTAPTGTINLWGLLPICHVNPSVTGALAVANLLTGIPFPPRLLAGEQIIIIGVGTTARAVSGFIRFVGDS